MKTRPTIQFKQRLVTQGILKAFADKFGTEEKPVDFETCWPISKWETLQTETRTFLVELHLTTGKVIEITEEF